MTHSISSIVSMGGDDVLLEASTSTSISVFSFLLSVFVWSPLHRVIVYIMRKKRLWESFELIELVTDYHDSDVDIPNLKQFC